MKRVVALLIVLCLFVSCAFAGESIVSETQLSPRLIEGNYHWIFDVTFTNDTEEPLTVVSVESLDRFAGGDVCSWHKTGTQLVEERYAEKARLEPGESLSLYLTTQQLPIADEKLFVITARTDNFQPVCRAYAFHLLETEKYVPQTPVQPESHQESQMESQPAHMEVDADNTIHIYPDMGPTEPEWRFAMIFPNDTGRELTLRNMEAVDYMNGTEVGHHAFTPADINFTETLVAPGEEFAFHDCHPVVDFFNTRKYLLSFTDDAGETFVFEFMFALHLGEGQSPAREPSLAPVSPVSEDGLLHPEFDGQLYAWQFNCVFPNDTDSTLAFIQVDIIHVLDGVDLDVFTLPAEHFPDLQKPLAPGEIFSFLDGHPAVPDFNGCRYVFTFEDENGNPVVRECNFALSPDPLPAVEASDLSDDTGFDLTFLRHDADFCVQVAADVYWVPASALGQSAYSNGDIYRIRSMTPEEKQAEIHTLYEALQLYQISGFAAADDNVRIAENGVHWEHHKPGYYAVLTNEGCCATDSNWLNYLLQNDYEEVGFLATSQPDGSGHVFNYILHDGWYYFIDLTQYRAADHTCAPESGDLTDYYSSPFPLANVHKAATPGDYIRYLRSSAGDPPGLCFLYTAPDCLPVDSLQDDNGVTILYGTSDEQSAHVIFDDPYDALYPAFTQPPTQTFDWSAIPAYPFS